MGAAQVVILCLMALSIGLSAWAVARDVPPVWRFAVPERVPETGVPRFETVFAYDVAAGQAHSASVVVTGDGFDVLWFEGSQEAQADVDIHGAAVRRGPEGWQVAGRDVRITRGALGEAMEPAQLVVTLGNTVENERVPGRVFATVVSVGGWAMASVADVEMGAGGPVAARKLNLSPFLNRSHLVKAPMVAFADGSVGLPAYFEMGAAHGVLVRFGPGGRVRDTARMAGEGQPIQPMIVPLGEDRAVAWLRDFAPSGKLLVSHTENGGRTWSEVVPSDMPNPSAPVAALALGGGRILMAANDDPDGGDRLRLLLSEDEGDNWRVLRELAPNGAGARYPMLRRLEGGEIALAYSVGNKTGVRAHVLNGAWVAAQ
ncbi:MULTISPECIES: exo-alpha-sialidase [unclassified Roseovarius]|uniref:exo-alpha-sialidase n=1 Tax=unclassified Roseovarius TaxID=2614913 RepID=UPI00273F21EE|nr:exo-alpha-sialidase [Roseovarius sp. MMSF_3350]